jgi:hypothetical protein
MNLHSIFEEFKKNVNYVNMIKIIIQINEINNVSEEF